MSEKLCLFCTNYRNEQYYEYSELTAGGGYLTCDKGHHEAIVMHNDGIDEYREAVLFAEKCPDYDRVKV